MASASTISLGPGFKWNTATKLLSGLTEADLTLEFIPALFMSPPDYCYYFSKDMLHCDSFAAANFSWRSCLFGVQLIFCINCALTLASFSLSSFPAFLSVYFLWILAGMELGAIIHVSTQCLCLCSNPFLWIRPSSSSSSSSLHVGEEMNMQRREDFSLSFSLHVYRFIGLSVVSYLYATENQTQRFSETLVNWLSHHF